MFDFIDSVGNFSSRSGIKYPAEFSLYTGKVFVENGVSHAPSFPLSLSLAGLFHTRVKASIEPSDQENDPPSLIIDACSVDGSGVCTRQQCGAGAGAAAACDYRDFTSGSRGSRRDKSSSTRFVELAFSAFSNRCSVIY